MKNYTKDKILATTQTSVVIPTGELIKNKKVDLRVLACVSAISNVDDWSKECSNTRYCTIKKFNDNLNAISDLLVIKRGKIISLVKAMVEVGSEELKNTIKEYQGEKVSVLECKYFRGGFVTIELEMLERLVSSLNNNAFKLYVNLLWICRDNLNSKNIEKAISQEYLCQTIGLAKSSTKTVRRLENELIDNSLLLTRVIWETGGRKPRLKKYYKLLSV